MVCECKVCSWQIEGDFTFNKQVPSAKSTGTIYARRSLPPQKKEETKTADPPRRRVLDTVLARCQPRRMEHLLYFVGAAGGVPVDAQVPDPLAKRASQHTPTRTAPLMTTTPTCTFAASPDLASFSALASLTTTATCNDTTGDDSQGSNSKPLQAYSLRGPWRSLQSSGLLNATCCEDSQAKFQQCHLYTPMPTRKAQCF